MSKIFVTSCDTTPKGGRAQAHKILELYELSDKIHQITYDPSTADIILICDAIWEKNNS